MIQLEAVQWVEDLYSRHGSSDKGHGELHVSGEVITG